MRLLPAATKWTNWTPEEINAIMPGNKVPPFHHRCVGKHTEGVMDLPLVSRSIEALNGSYCYSTLRQSRMHLRP